MPKPHTFPTLYNEALQIHISKLKEWGYLNGTIITAPYVWSIEGQRLGRISITVNTQSLQPFIELGFKYKDEPRKYKVKLISLPSNLGKGIVWYFICPHTNKRCRKLYLVDGYFLHREAFKKCLYESQTKSKRQRQLNKVIDFVFNSDCLHNQLNEKHFKKTYAGKPTKKYLKIMEQIQKAESIPLHEIERIMLSSKTNI